MPENTLSPCIKELEIIGKCIKHKFSILKQLCEASLRNCLEKYDKFCHARDHQISCGQATMFKYNTMQLYLPLILDALSILQLNPKIMDYQVFLFVK